MTRILDYDERGDLVTGIFYELSSWVPPDYFPPEEIIPGTVLQKDKTPLGY